MDTLSIEYTYLNEDDIDSELKCSICNDPFQSPMNCLECGQTFCERCIFLWSKDHPTCPLCRRERSYYGPVISRVVRNQLDRLAVRCSLCEEENIQRGNFHAHLTNTCPKQLVACAKNCGWKGCRELFEKHQSKCRKQRFSLWHISSWW